jgi:porin
MSAPRFKVRGRSPLGNAMNGNHLQRCGRYAACLAAALLAIIPSPGDGLLGAEGLAGFARVAEAETPVENWGPAPTDKLSLVNSAPLLLPFLNNSPVFGIPGTVVGEFWEQTQVTGDWGGARTKLARHGVFFDVYTTSTYQNVTAAGLETGETFWNNTQISLNIDTGRAGLWPGGLIHVTAQARNGDSAANTFTIGTYVPQHYGLLLPGPKFSDSIYLSDYYLVQAVNKRLFLIGGVISGLFLPDQTLFGDAYRYAFTNFNLNKNPFFANYYGPTALAGLAVWAPAKWLVIEGGVLDPDTTADFASSPFEHVNVYLQVMINYKMWGLPGQFSLAGNWTNKPKLNLAAPFVGISPAEIGQTVAFLQGSAATPVIPPPGGLALNYEDESWFAIGNLSQYLYVKDRPEAILPKLKSGQPLRGIGVFGRFGYSPDKTNPVARHASIALHAHGLLDFRPNDSFGVGFYHNGTSDDLKETVSQATNGALNIRDEKGLEVFYSFALTPAIRVIPSYQHIRDPLLAQIKTSDNGADAFFVRLSVAW